MKNKLLLLMLAFICSMGMWAAEDPDWSVTAFSGSISNNSTTINSATWTLSGLTVGSNANGEPAWALSSNKWKFGNSKNQFWSSYTISTDAFSSYNVTKVEVGCYDNGSTESSVTVKQGDVTIGSADVSTTTTTNVETLSENSGEGGTLSITFASTKQASYITSIKVYYSTGGDTPSTPTALSAPTNLSSSNVTTTGATLLWDAVDNASSYTVKIGTTEYTDVNTNSYSATGLTAGTQYTWTVKAVGDGANYTTSAYAADANFTTEAEQGTEPEEPSGNALTIDFESETSAYTDWTFTNITTKQTNSGVLAHGASYFGTTGGKTTGSVQTKNMVNPGTITFYVSKQTTNTTSSNWKIQVSKNGTSWTDVKTQSATSMDKGTWVEVTQDLSEYSNVYVRVYYDGSTAVRCIDDLSLTLVEATTPDPEKTVTSISVTGTPAIFWKGDTFNHNGMTVTATYDDETIADVTSQAEFSTPDMTTAGTKTVTVTYKDKTATYDINLQTIANTQENAYTVAQAVALIDAGKDLSTEVYVAGKICQIDSYSDQYKSITYWISTDGTTANKFEVYSGKNLNNTDFTAVSDIVLGADVVIYGVIKKYSSTYEFDKNNYLVSYTAPVVKTKPELSFAKSSVTAYLDALDEFESQTVTTNPANLTGVQYSTSDKTKATVDANTGVVTINTTATPGSVTITASYAETEVYAAADDASYIINIVANKPVAVKRAIVAQMNDKYYAATTEVSNNKLVAVEISVVDNKVVYTGDADIVWDWEATAGTLITNDGKTLAQTGTGTNINLTGDNVTWHIDSTLGLVNAETTGRALVCNGSVFGNYSKDNVGKSGYTGKASLMEIAEVSTITISSVEYATYYNAEHAYFMPDDCEGFVFTVADGLELAYESGEVVPAGEPLVIYTIDPGKKTLVFTTSKEETYIANDMNDLKGAATNMTASDMTAANPNMGKFYAFSLNKDGKKPGFYWINDGGAAFDIPARKVYLALPPATEANAFVFEDDDVVTLIDKVINSKPNGVAYNLNGQRVSANTKGIVIINGHKYINK